MLNDKKNQKSNECIKNPLNYLFKYLRNNFDKL